jgi:hypothetical protein
LGQLAAPVSRAVAADRRPVSYYIFMALSALALFAVSMFVTILLMG